MSGLAQHRHVLFSLCELAVSIGQSAEIAHGREDRTRRDDRLHRDVPMRSGLRRTRSTVLRPKSEMIQ